MRDRALAVRRATAWALLLAGLGCGSTDASLSALSPACLPLADLSGFPPGYDFVPPPAGGPAERVLVATFSRSTLVPLDVGTLPFRSPDDAADLELPADADSDGRDDPGLAIDDVALVSPGLALVTTSGVERVIFVHPRGELVARTLATPLGLDGAELPGWPEPGSEALRTGMPTGLCIVPGPDARDSFGVRLDDPDDPPIRPTRYCREGVPSFRASFTSGAVEDDAHLFVGVSNLGTGQGTRDTQYLPAAVLAFEIDRGASPPVLRPRVDTPSGGPVLLGSPDHFNVTDVSLHTTASGRALLLATLSGAVGIEPDDPGTPQLDAGTVRLGDGAVDVFDAATGVHLATLPLPGANPSFRGPAISPDGRLAVFGDLASRALFVIDLRELDALPEPAAVAEPVILDGVGEPSPVVFGGDNPLRLPHLSGGAPEASCSGRIDSVAWGAAGDVLYAVDDCDGSLFVVEVDGRGEPTTREWREGRIAVSRVVPLVAPRRADTVGRPQGPSALKLRPGAASGPDLFFLVSQQAQLCGVSTEAL